MTYEIDPRVLTLAGLVHRCASETTHFFEDAPFDPRFCFELFRRAIVHRNDRAWEYVNRQYLPLVLKWVSVHPLFPVSDEEPEYFANRAFEKMWNALTPEKFTRFLDLKALLRYLQMCVHSALIDHMRRANPLDSIDELSANTVQGEEPVEDRVMAQVQGEMLWQAISSRLQDDRERLVMELSLQIGLRPREIRAQFPETFAEIDEIYKIKQNVFARLRRDPEVKKFLDIGD